MLRVECYGMTVPQYGRETTLNQDAFLINRQPIHWMALADGAGNAMSAGQRAIDLLDERVEQASLAKLLHELTWTRWLKSLDQMLSGGPQTTLVAASVVSNQVIGCSVGDSRAYHVPFEGTTRELTLDGTKARLGSGEVRPTVFRCTLQPRDVLLLVSDGVWTQLGSSLSDTVRSHGLKPFADAPQALIDAASRRGRADDMTAVTLRLLTIT